MKIQEFPKELQILLKGMDCETNNIGRSTAGVYKYYNSKISYYLKIQPICHGLRREYEIMKWLYGKILKNNHRFIINI